MPLCARYFAIFDTGMAIRAAPPLIFIANTMRAGRHDGQDFEAAIVAPASRTRIRTCFYAHFFHLAYMP